MMGEIKVALKKEVKTEGDQLVLEILQCRNITYKFKSPDHLPGLCARAQRRACTVASAALRASLIPLSSIAVPHRSIRQAVCGERRYSEEDHQEEDQSVPT